MSPGGRSPSLYSYLKPVLWPSDPHISQAELFGNYPNPFTGQTIIPFALPEAQPVVLSVFDAQGKQLRHLQLDGHEGYQEVKLDLNNLSTGVYLYRLQGEGWQAVRRMVRE